MTATFAVVLALVLTGGTSYAAEGALPGDALYGVKTEVNENIRSAFAFSNEAEAELQADLFEERVDEAQELAAAGELDAENAVVLKDKMKEHLAIAADLLSEADTKGEVVLATRSRLSSALSEYNALIQNDTALALDIDAGVRLALGGDGAAGDQMALKANTEAETSATMSTSLALAPVETSALITNTKARIEALYALIQNNRTEMEATTYAKLDATLDEATELLVTAQAEREETGRETAYKAADAAGRVEAALSILGQVTINPDTGAIISIDFNNPPPLDEDREGLFNKILNDELPQEPADEDTAGGEDTSANNAEASFEEGATLDVRTPGVEVDATVGGDAVVPILY